MMPDPHRLLTGLRLAGSLVLLVSTLSCAASGKDAPRRDAEAARGESEWILAAEDALRVGNCRDASENYLGAARVSDDAGVAARATQLALGCEQLATARAAAARWRELVPYSGEAALAASVVALKRYDLAAARQELAAWRDSGSAGSQDPLRFAELLQEETSATAVHQVFSEVLVGEDPTAAVRLAQARLAMGAQNMTAAITAAQQARKLDAGLVEAASIELRARSVLGEHDAAIAGARALGEALDGDNAFLVADLLSAADRDTEAREELERLAAGPRTRLGAEHRLIGFAIEEGQYDAAETRLAALLDDRSATALTYYYVAQLAERRDDLLRAARTYQLLFDTPIALQARGAMARLMLRNGNREAAMRVLDEYLEQKPETAVEVGAMRAQLLARHEDVDAALVVLDALLDRYPDHPDLMYQRATVLEGGNRSREAIAQLEKLHGLRPDDPQVSNALGFTMADHGRRLPRAEQLVRSALAVSPDSPAIQDSMGWVLFRQGRVKESLPMLERAWFNSRDAEIAAHFGEALWKSGEEGRARYIWQQALNSAPEDKRLRETVARLTGEAPPAAR